MYYNGLYFFTNDRLAFLRYVNSRKINFQKNRRICTGFETIMFIYLHAKPQGCQDARLFHDRKQYTHICKSYIPICIEKRMLLLCVCARDHARNYTYVYVNINVTFSSVVPTTNTNITMVIIITLYENTMCSYAEIFSGGISPSPPRP